MASEYLKWLARNEKPEEPRVLTKEEKWKNWWHYNKWFVAAGVLLLAGLVSIVRTALTQVEPDYQIAYVGASTLPEDTANALEAQLAGLGEDLNGDGRVTVRLVQYVSSDDSDPGLTVSAEVQLAADIMERESYFFLLEDPERFQERYHSLRRLDGSLPDDDDLTAQGTCLRWADCPVLAGLELGEYSYELLGGSAQGSSDELVSGLFIGRRGFWTEKTAAHAEGCEAFWEKITEGAVS